MKNVILYIIIGNEQYAIDLLQNQRDVIFPTIEKYNGIVHKELGDGLLVSLCTLSKNGVQNCDTGGGIVID